METKINYTEATEPKTANVNNNKKDSPSLWKSVVMGGIPGIMIGFASSVAYNAAAASSTEEVEPVLALEDEVANEEIKEANNINDEMTFNEAFAAARKEVGPAGAFSWHGKIYSAYRGDDPEWLEMSEEERAEHSRLLLSQFHRVPFTPREEETQIMDKNEDADVQYDDNNEEIQEEIKLEEEQIVVEDERNSENDEENETMIEEIKSEEAEEFKEQEKVKETEDDESDMKDEDIEIVEHINMEEEGNADLENVVEEVEDIEEGSDQDITISGVKVIGTNNGSVIAVGIGEIDNHYTELIDMDSDGEIDTVLIDANDDGHFNAEEMVDVSGEGLTVEDMVTNAVVDNLTEEITLEDSNMSEDINDVEISL